MHVAEHVLQSKKNVMGPVPCKDILCKDCYFKVNAGSRCNDACKEWCESEYVEPQIDWSKVPVDTPILVRDHESALWRKAHFAKYKNNKIYTWFGGGTSWSGTGMVEWKYAKLAEESEQR